MNAVWILESIQLKIRDGFVSNSSSTSFCVYGTAVNIDLIIEKVVAWYSIRNCGDGG